MSEPAIPAAPAAATAAAGAAGIHKRFGSTHALRGVGLSLYPGRCLGLVGRNGAGKSTLVSILSGIYPAYFRNEKPIASLWNCLNVSGIVGIIVQRLP